DGGAERPRRGPFAKDDLGDHARLHEPGLPWRLAAIERTLVPLEGLELPGEQIELLVAEAASHPARVAQAWPILVVLVIADQDRAERSLAPALSREPAADYEILT